MTSSTGTTDVDLDDIAFLTNHILSRGIYP